MSLEILFKPAKSLIFIAKTGIHIGQILSDSLAPGILHFEFFQYGLRLSPPSRYCVAVAKVAQILLAFPDNSTVF